jgi:hypothetical protein
MRPLVLAIIFSNMALINIDSALKRVLSQVKKLGPNQGLEILSYKRNRGVTLVKLARILHE